MMRFIAMIRKALLMPFPCKWNAWVRDGTATLEGIVFYRAYRRARRAEQPYERHR
jgi:hypothetical protein